MTPKISICVPNLNTRPYLPERFNTIFNQTLQDFEVIVYDSHSDDGAWEYIQETAARDPRVRAFQGPREKPPACWNPCINEARGEYVYIATSDDTMMPGCLEKMAAALDANPECGLCQCGLEVIDAAGAAHPSMKWRGFAFGRYANGWLDRPHIRRAPLDGVLHCALQTVYTSITQLLICRRVFDRVGMFDGTWGPKSDFEWGMRAGLLEDCVFIPETLATWRVHPQQATGDTESGSVRRAMMDMARAAYEKAARVPGNKLAQLPLNRLMKFYREQIVRFGVREARGRSGRLAFLAGEIMRGNSGALEYLLDRKRGVKFQEPAQFDELSAFIRRRNLPPPVFF